MNTDGWSNLLTGLGKLQDKTRYTTYSAGLFIPDEELTSLYINNGLVARIVDSIADDMTRGWIIVENDDNNKISNELEKLSAESIFNLALKWARLYGGSLIVLGFNDGKTLDKPVSEKYSQINWLKVIPRSQIVIGNSDYIKDTSSLYFGEIEKYTLFMGYDLEQIQVHKSRTIEFKGAPLPYDNIYTDIERRYWGVSIIQKIWEDLQIFGSVYQSIANILLEFIIGKYSLAGLRNMLAQGQEELILKRLELINKTKSILNGILLDDTEKYERDTASVAGLADLMDRYQMNLAGVSNYPVTRLFGRSPAGMNATGESDTLNYYDGVKSEQGNILKKPIQKLVNIISIYLGLSKNSNDVKFPIIFNPLFQMTEKEETELNKIKSDTYNTYINNGVLDNMEVREKEFPELDSIPESNEMEE